MQSITKLEDTEVNVKPKSEIYKWIIRNKTSIHYLSLIQSYVNELIIFFFLNSTFFNRIKLFFIQLSLKKVNLVKNDLILLKKDVVLLHLLDWVKQYENKENKNFWNVSCYKRKEEECKINK